MSPMGSWFLGAVIAIGLLAGSYWIYEVSRAIQSAVGG